MCKFSIQQKRSYLKSINFFTNIKLDIVKKRSIYKAAYGHDHVDINVDMYVCSVEDLTNNVYL